MRLSWQFHEDRSKSIIAGEGNNSSFADSSKLGGPVNFTK